MDKARAKGEYVKCCVGVVAIGATSMLRLIRRAVVLARITVANLGFELGAESSVAETEIIGPGRVAHANS